MPLNQTLHLISAISFLFAYGLLFIDAAGFVHNVGMIGFALGVSGLLLRTVHLSFRRGPSWGLAWATKIVTDPFHNVAIDWKSPLTLLRGERYDPLEAPTPDRRHMA